MMLATMGKLGLFLVALVSGGLLIVPRAVPSGGSLAAPRNHSDRLHRNLLWSVDPRRARRILGSARRLPGRFDGGRVRRNAQYRAFGDAAARHFRRGVFYFSRDDARSDAARPALDRPHGPGAGCDPREVGWSDHGFAAFRGRDSHFRAGRHEPHANRRVLVHHRGAWRLDACETFSTRWPWPSRPSRPLPLLS